MAFQLIPQTGWVETDGSYGVGSIITFDQNDLTDHQWEVLSDLRDNDRLGYVHAIMAGEPLDEWERN